MSIKLFIIATPIGNLSDLSDRTREVISDIDLIFAEDTRVSKKLLHHIGVSPHKLISCHKFNEKSRFKQLTEAFEKGMDVALMSDAGTPLLSDPGQSLVSEAISLGFEICAIPGPTALVQALVGSGLPCDRFSFEGFLPDKEGQLRKHLLELADEKRTLVFYVSPHNLLKRIDTMIEVLGDRNACLAKELTKKFERYFRGTLSSIKQELNEENLKGEFTLVLAGKNKDDELKVDVSDDTVTDFILDAHRKGHSVKEIARLVADRYSVKKSEAYSRAVEVVQKKKD